ncbi:MAG TPA: hypothetical protein VEY91_05050 [Candidatus Limnocylindria bacterium]|nr:hypothetical protein [Candidatus Limnocylindria bacterium]
MVWRVACVVGLVWNAGWLLAASEARADGIVLPRPGQVGISGQGGYGTLFSSGVFGEDFGSGPSIAVRLRYRMRYERALGLSFENQRFDAREAAPGDTAFDSMNLVLSGIEFYQLFGTRTKATRMLMVGAGLAQPSAELRNGETFFFTGGDGLYVSAGAGLERFFYRSWAWDLSFRYYALFKDGDANHQVQAALGVIFYAGY